MLRTEERPEKKAFILIADLDKRSDSYVRRVMRTAKLQLTRLNYKIKETDLVNEEWDVPISAADFEHVSDPIRINFRVE
jgi:hypothetical protein